MHNRLTSIAMFSGSHFSLNLENTR